MSQPETASGLHSLFEETANNYDSRIEVGQGHEAISQIKPLISRGFAQCSALLLIDKISGLALLKHAGPRSLEVFSGDRGIGEGLQDNYNFFKQHTAKHAVLMVPVNGTISYNREELASRVKEQLESTGSTVEALAPIIVPSTQWKWQIYFAPTQGHLVTKHYMNNDAVYQLHALAGLDPAKQSPRIAAEMAKKLEVRELEHQLKAQIKKHTGSGNTQELAAELAVGQKSIGPTALYGILANRLDDWNGQTAAQICIANFTRLCSRQGSIPPEQAIRCIEVLARFDMQDDATRGRYISQLFNMSYETKKPELKACIIAAAQGMIDQMQDTAKAKRMSNYLKNEL